MTKIDIGLSEDNRQKAANGLTKLLADTYTLYLKTHNFHWNVTGPQFTSLHLLFEQQYTELALAVDKIAERVRALGFMVPASYADFSKLTSIKEAIGDKAIKAEDMIKRLVSDQATIIHQARALFGEIEKSSDQSTLDLLTERMDVHEKNAWMLRSLLD